MDDSSVDIGAMIEESAVDPLIGAVLKGKYQIIDQLGRGGMGAVYRALDVNVNRTVAVKLVGDMLRKIDRERAIARFKREAGVGGKLNHQNIVQVYDFDVTEDGLEFLVMEYVPHKTLGQLLNEELTLKPTDAVRIISQVLVALEACRDAFVIHRDLKPGNILLMETDSGPVVKICDFGLGKTEGDQSDLTVDGHVVGTPKYMSPEQCRGEEPTHQSDLYAIGVILYEMLAGKPPFEGGHGSIICKHLSKEPTVLYEKVGGGLAKIPQALSEAVMRALKKLPEERYQTAGQMRGAIIRALRQPATPKPRRPTSHGGTSAAKPVQRKRRTSTRQLARPAMPPKKKVSVLPWVAGMVAVVAVALGLGYRFMSQGQETEVRDTPIARQDAPKQVEPKPDPKPAVAAPPPVQEKVEVKTETAVPVAETLPETRDADELLRLANKYSLKGKSDLMIQAYQRFLQVAGKNHPRRRFVEARLRSHRKSNK